MSCSARVFRAAIGLGVFWLMWALLINFQSVRYPEVVSGAYMFAAKDLSKPIFMEAFTPAYKSALDEKAAGQLAEYDLEFKGIQNDTTFFIPASMGKNQPIRILRASLNTMRQEQEAMRGQKRIENAIYTLKVALIPTLALLAIGIAISGIITLAKRPSHRLRNGN